MRARVVVGLALVASCGFSPKPKNGALPCDEGCPDGYVCRSDNRCWLASTPIADSAVDGPSVGKDLAALDTGLDVGGGSTAEAGRDAAIDASPIDDTGKMDVGIVDMAGSADADATSIDEPVGTGGTGGGGDASGVDSASLDGASAGTGGAAGGAGGAGGRGGSGAGGTIGGTGGSSVTGTGGSSVDDAGTGGSGTGGSGSGGTSVVGTGGSGTGGMSVVGTGGSGGSGTGGSTVCVAGVDKQCADSTHLKTCGTDGQWPATGTLCPYTCIDNPGNTDVCGACTPGTDKQCADTTHLKTCGTDGQWPATGMLCPYTCIDNSGNTDVCGACTPAVDKQCTDPTHLRTCGADGQWPATGDPCGAGTPLCRGDQCVASVPYHLGNDAPLPTPSSPVFYTAPASVLYAIPIAVQNRTQVTSFGMVGRLAGNNVVMALYADATPSSTTPTSPAGRVVSSLATAVAVGSFLVPVTGVVNIQPGNYWLAALHDVAVATYYDNAAGTSARAAYATLGPPNPYPAIPTTFPTSTPVTGYKYDLYVVLQDY